MPKLTTADRIPMRVVIVTLDLIRGIAVMGIFSVNVIAFAMVFPAYMNPRAMGGHTGIDAVTWFANFVLIDGKMRSLFSMLFGASMMLVIERAVAGGRCGGATHFRRMIVLAVIGLFHFYVIWFGDILFLYAVTGMVAFLFRRASPRKLLVWSVSLFLLSTAMMTSAASYFYDLDKQANAAGASSDRIEEWNAAMAWGAQTQEAQAKEVAIYRGALPERVEHTLQERAAEPFATLVFFFPETLALMLLGMAGFRSGYLTGQWPDRSYRRIALWALTLGAAASAVLAFMIWRSDFYLPLIFLNLVALGTPVRVVMALGYAALIILVFRKPGWFRDRLAAVGRAAFSNYLGTSVVAALIFYGDGLGLFARLSRFEAWLTVPLVWALMLAWSKPWLDRFHYGPLEWLWRSLARMELQPMRKRPPPRLAAAAE